MEELKRVKITRRAQRAQATKTWNKAETLMAGEINEISIQRLQVVLETFNTKLEQLKRIDESISSKIENELEAEIVEADDNLNELMDKRYRIQFFITSSQPSTPINYNNMSAPSASENQGGILLFKVCHNNRTV
jgi:division protein CdvB (Snf7/Vps24/ESCRT-III family)